MHPDSWSASPGKSALRPTTAAPSLAIAFVTVFLPVPVPAADMDVESRERCERRGIARVVELRETPGDGLPCEVLYLKPDEDGSARVLWTARTDRGFCAARFDELLVKMESRHGWSCEPADGPPAPAEVSAASASPPTPSDSTPELAAAMPETVGTSGEGEAVSSPLDRLRALVPPGAYIPVPMPSEERAGDVRVPPFCPSGGLFSWEGDDPERAVLALGETIRLTVWLPEDSLDEGSVLGITASAGQGVTREFLTLSPVSSDPLTRAVDVRVAPRGPGSGALSPDICRYAFDG